MTGTYGDMQTRIADELLTGATITTAQICLEIQSAITYYQREHWWFEEAQTTLTTTAGQTTANSFPPADWNENESFDLTYAGHPYPLESKSWAWYVAIGGRDTTVGRGPPGRYVIYQQLMYLYPVPDATYSMLMSYTKKLTTLSAGTDTNAWMTEGEELIRFRARQALRINYASDDAAKLEAATMSAAQKSFLSAQEEQAYRSLTRTSVGKITTGRVTSTRF